MDFKELTAELENFKDTDDYKNYMNGSYTVDGVSKYLESDNGRQFLQPILDKYHSKGLESWKANNLENLINDEVKKRFPEADPKDAEINKLKQEFEQMKREVNRKELTNSALKLATEHHLPVELIDYFVSDDAETTTKNLETFEKVFNQSVATNVDTKIKGTTHIPARENPENMSGVEKAFFDANPNLK